MTNVQSSSGQDDGFLTVAQIKANHEANEAAAAASEQTAEGSEAPVGAKSEEERVAREPETAGGYDDRVESEAEEDGFFGSLVDSATETAKSGLEGARELIDDVEAGVDAAGGALAEVASEIDAKVEEVKAEVKATAEAVKSAVKEEADAIVRDCGPFMESAEAVARAIDDDVTDINQIRTKIEEADDELADGAKAIAERHFGEAAGEFVRETMDEKDVSEGLAHALLVRHIDSPAEVGELIDNAAVRTGLDIGLSVAEKALAAKEELRHGEVSNRVLERVVSGPVATAGRLYWDHAIEPKFEGTFGGVKWAVENRETFKEGALVLSPENLEKRLSELEPRQKAVMTLGGELSAHIGIGGKLGAEANLEIEALEDGGFLVKASTKDNGGIGVGTETAGQGVSVNVGKSREEFTLYRCADEQAARRLLGLQGGESMEEADRASDQISIVEQSTKREMGLSGSMSGGISADLSVRTGLLDPESSAEQVLQPFVEVGGKFGSNAIYHANLNDAFQPAKAGSAGALLDPAAGWLDESDLEHLRQVLTPEQGEVGLALAISAEISAKVVTPRSLKDDGDYPIEAKVSVQFRNGNEVFTAESIVRIERPGELAGSLGMTTLELQQAIASGRLSPTDIAALAKREGVDLVRGEFQLKHTHSRGRSAEFPSLKFRDQVETTEVLHEFNDDTNHVLDMLDRIRG